LQMQLQLERQQAQVARQQQLERGSSVGANRRSTPTNSTLANAVAAARATSSPLGPLITGPTNNNSSTQGSAGAAGGAAAASGTSQFLLSRVGLDIPTDEENFTQEAERVERGQFVQDLLLSTLLMEGVDLNGDFLQSLEDESHPFSEVETGTQQSSNHHVRIWPYSEPPSAAAMDSAHATSVGSRLLDGTSKPSSPVRFEAESGQPALSLGSRDSSGSLQGNDAVTVMIGGLQDSSHLTNGIANDHCDHNFRVMNQRPVMNGSNEESDGVLDALISADELLFPSLSGLSENSHDGFPAGQPGELEQRVRHQPHGRPRHRVSKEGLDTQNRRAKEREPPPPPH